MMTKDAIISECGMYRYTLTRKWDETKMMVLFIMLNPSVADSEQDDPTIRRCIGFAKDWDYGGICVVNLFAFRATNPSQLLYAEDPVGNENEDWIEKMGYHSHMVVCAWGNSQILKSIQKRLKRDYWPLHRLSKPLHYLDLSIDGTPKHPLYLQKGLLPTRFTMPKNAKLSYNNF